MDCFSLDPDRAVDLKLLAEGIKRKLPKYARPIFVRLIQELQLTGTYKLKKSDLQAEGYDLTKFSDPVYFMRPEDETYSPLTGITHDKIQRNQLDAKL